MGDFAHCEWSTDTPTAADEQRCANCNLRCKQCEVDGLHTLRTDPACTACAGTCPPRCYWRGRYAKQTLVSVPHASTSQGSWRKNQAKGTFEIRPDSTRTKYEWISKHQVARTDNRRGRALCTIAPESDEKMSGASDSSSNSMDAYQHHDDADIDTTSDSSSTSSFKITFGLDSLFIPNMLEEFSDICADAEIFLEDSTTIVSRTTDSNESLSGCSTTMRSHSPEHTSKRRASSQDLREPSDDDSNKLPRLNWVNTLDPKALVWHVQPVEKGSSHDDRLSA
mmetsp:Transcript_17717/g.38650  ORF Transcript_17717/g.38650 Transcript_17717/m.38650 type:complete len:281 (+) Transcript_17717:147-989(+)|eukprot:CAMPEP_0118935230 /NCGR_PEP_ID=MMETSP1169-20130426/15214_1 /TAXON_ID=36882 /ORGANISM="Pyramimonas obovata, Strain CCMP722" /LENGTH=280 /DNA_ID=CAMNT_0006878237 /DNA_START=111 /DNA_END=953 /DNA_ORIENTATION=+